MTATLDTPEAPHNTWTLTPDELDATRDKIAQINKRATRKGLTGHLDLDVEQTTRTRKNSAGIEITEVVYKVAITGQPPRYITPDGEWTLLAAVDFDPHAGVIVRTAPGVEKVNRDLIAEGKCDHCRVNRQRRKYTLLTSPTGEQIQVGSACLKDYLGITATPTMFFDAEGDLDSFIGGLGGGAVHFTPETVLAAAWAVIQENGYVRSGEVGSTRALVEKILNPYTSADRDIARDYAPLIEQAVPKAVELREWLLSDEFSGDSEYVLNLKAIAGGEKVSPRNIGLLVSAPQAYARAQERTLIRQREAAEIRNEYVGEVKDRIEVEVRVKSVTWRQGDWSVTTIYTLLSKEGQVFKWFASSDALGDKPTEHFVPLKGTVKKHKEWNGIKETHLTRCKRLD